MKGLNKKNAYATEFTHDLSISAMKYQNHNPKNVAYGRPRVVAFSCGLDCSVSPFSSVSLISGQCRNYPAASEEAQGVGVKSVGVHPLKLQFNSKTKKSTTYACACWQCIIYMYHCKVCVVGWDWYGLHLITASINKHTLCQMWDEISTHTLYWI